MNVETRYRGEAGRAYQQGKRAVPTEAFGWVARLRAEKFQPHIRPTDAVIEFGVGLGWNLAEMRCHRRVGADLEDFLSGDLQNQGIEFVRSTTDLPGAAFDVVLCHHVLEHVEQPLAMLSEAKRLLRPSGKLLLYVPFEIERKYRQFDPEEPNHHLYSWNVQTLGNLVTTGNFMVESGGVGQFGYDRIAAILALRIRLGERAFRALRRLGHLARPGLEVRIIARPETSQNGEGHRVC